MRLDGNRILLREYRKEDLANIRSWVGDPDVENYLSDVFLRPHTQNNTERFLNHVLEMESTDEFHFVIEEKSTKEYLGQIDIVEIDWKNRVAEFGVVIGIKAKRGQGYGYEAIKLLQYFVFNRLNLNSLELRLHDYNVRAYRCYLKCGFIEEGRLRKDFYMDGKYRDTIIMGILKSEFKGQNLISQIVEVFPKKGVEYVFSNAQLLPDSQRGQYSTVRFLDGPKNFARKQYYASDPDLAGGLLGFRDQHLPCG